MQEAHPFSHLKKTLKLGDKTYEYYSLAQLKDPRIQKLPFSIRVLLESAIRNCDEFNIKKVDVEKILDWVELSKKDVEIPFKPARVILQDFTGVPAVVDLAAMRDAVQRLGGNPDKINPLCPVDLVIDHSVQVDVAGTKDALEKNEEIEFNRNRQRFQFLKWGQQAFDNFLIVPPGSGIVHQVNLQYLARVVFNSKENILYPDSVVGTDSHTTMINGLGVLGWGVGGIEAQAVMLGQTISMVLPQVVGFRLINKLPYYSTATDLVLKCVNMLRKRGVVGKFVEYFGPGVASLTLADRATLSNMAPQYGATMGFFPVDDQTVEYLKLTARDDSKIGMIAQYLRSQGLYRTYDGSQSDPVYSGQIMELDLSTVEPAVSGPKRPHDFVLVKQLMADFQSCMNAKLGFKGFSIDPAHNDDSGKATIEGKQYILRHGSVVIAAITSCTNTSNPGVMLAAGLLAQKAVEKGLTVSPAIKCSLSPGSGVVTDYFKMADVEKYLDKLGFTTAGYGCMTCIGNSGDLHPQVSKAISEKDLVAAAVLSGNRNFEGRVHPQTRANYLASPPLVVAYALAGNVQIDFEKQALGTDKDGKQVFLMDIWPERKEVDALIAKVIKPQMFSKVYGKISNGTQRWNKLQAPEGKLYKWDEKSTYIHDPPFFKDMTKQLPKIQDVQSAYCLLNLGDSVTTDHISPAGKIAKTSPAAQYLKARGVDESDFNSYGSRRGNDEIMARGTFANIRLNNKMVGKTGPKTIHVPSKQEMSVFDAAERYIKDKLAVIILGGKEYGSGSSRDWAAKGPYLQGVRAVIAQSFERIHRSNLIGMGVLPLQFKDGESADSIGLTGFERFSLKLNGGDLKVGQYLKVVADNGKQFDALVRLDTQPEVQYYRNGGILHTVLRKLTQ